MSTDIIFVIDLRTANIMIQKIGVYVKIDDLILNYKHVDKEGNVFPILSSPSDFWDRDEIPLLFSSFNCRVFLEDIRKNGVKFCIAVNEDGTVDDGLCRIWCLKQLGHEYVEINLDYFTGKDKSFYPKKRCLG